MSLKYIFESLGTSIEYYMQINHKVDQFSIHRSFPNNNSHCVIIETDTIVLQTQVLSETLKALFLFS
jgi:hypothetical protein